MHVLLDPRTNLSCPMTQAVSPCIMKNSKAGHWCGLDANLEAYM